VIADDSWAVGYARVSSRASEASLASQREVIIAEAQRRGWAVHEVVEEVTARPDIDRLLASRPPRLIISTLDRLGRDLRELEHILERLRPWDGVLVSADGLDTGTPAGKMMVSVLVATAAYERELIARRALRNGGG
jgi:DNA invertase Pin-like site-specific DNA recombinase